MLYNCRLYFVHLPFLSYSWVSTNVRANEISCEIGRGGIRAAAQTMRHDPVQPSPLFDMLCRQGCLIVLMAMITTKILNDAWPLRGWTRSEDRGSVKTAASRVEAASPPSCFFYSRCPRRASKPQTHERRVRSHSPHPLRVTGALRHASAHLPSYHVGQGGGRKAGQRRLICTTLRRLPWNSMSCEGGKWKNSGFWMGGLFI